jgi:CcmD family protein
MNRILAGLTALALTLTSVIAFADDYADFDPQAAKAQISAPLFVTISYGAIWALILAFTVVIWRRQRRLEQELEAANARLAELLEAKSARGSQEGEPS